MMKNKRLKRWLTQMGGLATAALLTLCNASYSMAQSAEDKACGMLKFVDFSQLENGDAATSITSATYVRDQSLSEQDQLMTYKYSILMAAPVDRHVEKLPAHCNVEGYISPTIRFQIRLPAQENWNQRFLLSACDGFCGAVQTHRTMAGLVRNYATLTHDGGHSGIGFDGKWAKSNLQGKIDFAYRANHVLAVAAKAIIASYYGESEEYSIIAGCSKGGQAGVMAAQRYPQDFDGVIARGPTINYTKVNLINCMDNAKAVLDENDMPIMDASYAGFIHDSAVAACDALDGVTDGVIDDPRRCEFDPKSLSCEVNDHEKCLTEAQVDTVTQLYAASYDSQGNELYGGLPIGSEIEWPWWVMPIPGSPMKPVHYYAATEYMKYVAYPNESGIDNWRDFSYEQEKARLTEITPLMDADNPDLREFRDSGGKMIVLHGWSDAAIPAHASIKWYEDVMQFMGGVEATQDFAQMYLLPGVTHCGYDATGPNVMDGMAVLEKWMAEKQAPEYIVATKKDAKDMAVMRTKPIYPYPMQATYKGSGDISKASSYRLKQPQAD
ncbi:tannase/feruloyl esterase family alpha/beta hydrolase [Alteromonas sp. C1M14]|uniref:tannase/feruloyl esterase family alpha/beta hydrolase n=1 Tax=Alteromonas sp. C1M14 TaxID=2841567 RepID=UPI001C09E3E5|nr:tannase/feruloyl esterase family alpha/beta hydrolase [Alteromonas sp. C1M14]MBU2978551.1 tannase/feruloyl esterase family alpha/beta hydrolase [Alteromonas sp. C1M14]